MGLADAGNGEEPVDVVPHVVPVVIAAVRGAMGGVRPGGAAFADEPSVSDEPFVHVVLWWGTVCGKTQCSAFFKMQFRNEMRKGSLSEQKSRELSRKIISLLSGSVHDFVKIS